MFADHGLSTGNLALLVVCLLIAFAFEFANGFHDTANAVATVIYTNALPARVAVVLSGVCNFIGVFVGGLSVAMGIMQLLPVELLVAGGTGAGLSMVLALLLSAIIWNVGTWYFGLPASSSHTLIGAILGVGIANSMLPGHSFGAGVNWGKAADIGVSLLVSPLFGFGMAALLVLLVKRYTTNKGLLKEPSGEPPPPGTRALLVATCSGVSLAHGSNDGQKGVGLVMLILMGLLPAQYALDLGSKNGVRDTIEASFALEKLVDEHAAKRAAAQASEVKKDLAEVRAELENKALTKDIPKEHRFRVRQLLVSVDRALKSMSEDGSLALTDGEAKKLKKLRAEFRGLTEYAPDWVIACVALALGAGTMVGWRRIVVTVGEKIGKSHLTYAQGASAELVAASTIGISAWLGLPVSTTHVLSSGVAGTMVAMKSGVQGNTVRNIAATWVLTLPACVTISAICFWTLRLILG